MNQGFAYWHPALYHSLMRLLYGRHFNARYEAVARLIPPGASVIDACCGDCHLYDYLKTKGVDYTGLDANPTFVRHAARRGLKAKVADLRTDVVAPADFVVLQGSLYQFIPDHESLLKRLLASARKALIISEPVRNMAAGGRLSAWLADRATRVNGQRFPHRFSKPQLTALFEKLGAAAIAPIEGDRELIGLFRKEHR